MSTNLSVFKPGPLAPMASRPMPARLSKPARRELVATRERGLLAEERLQAASRVAQTAMEEVVTLSAQEELWSARFPNTEGRLAAIVDGFAVICMSEIARMRG